MGQSSKPSEITAGGNDRPLHDTIKSYPLINELQEVTITRSIVELRKKTESMNIETVSSTFIRRNLGGSLMKSLERFPGIKTIGIGSGQSKPLIRGLGFNRVVVIDNGVKHEGQQWGADHGLEIDQFAADEIELIKGAASFIYGSGAIGGIIDVKPPHIPAPQTLGGSIDLIGKTNNNLYGTSVNLFGRKQHLFFDARLTYQSYGDYRVPTDRVYVYNYAVDLYKNYLRNTAGHESGLHFNAGYIDDHFSNIFYISNTRMKSGFFANAHGLEPRNINAELHDVSPRDILMPSQEVNHFKIINRSVYQLGVHQYEAELSYQNNFRQEFSQYINHGYMPPVYPDTMRIPINLEREFDKQVYSLNLRDQMVLGKHRLTVGLNGEYQQNDINGWTFLIPAFKQTTGGIFIYDKFQLNDRMLLHGAIRYDYARIRMYKYTDWFNSEINEGGNMISQNLVRASDLNRSFHSLVWSAGLNYNLGKIAFKANVGKSFRVPIAKELGANGVNYHYFSYERGDSALSPEQSYQADLSLGWNEQNWSVQVSPFYNYFPNYIYLNPTADHDYYYGAGNQVFQYAQSQIMRYGGEIQLKWKFLKNLSTELLGEYLYSEQLSGDKKGYTLPFSPPVTGLLNFTWSPEINSLLKNNYLSLDYRVAAAQNNIVPPEKKTPGYQIVNVQAGTEFNLYGQQIMVSLQAQNLLNTRYMNHTSFYRLIELPEAGRSIILALKIPFLIGSPTMNINNNN
ncbi:TonB-dependent receptor [Albibacterium bauzanense]|uniref:Iron complex outermembrane receptor protein n=1 Tax=Albibacterium bauzanense TaxID=653929 RepID=A0A4R1LP79_9SPHI|nr:TonB-dependent receptor [Albibacterium bauzanense]TCK80876.1 iron complex outermembrane receptor protein [Albibacterium bauzanense]